MAKKLKTKTTDIRKLTEAALRKQVDEAHRSQLSMRLKKATGQLTNHRELPAVRRQIARLKTIERERQLAKAAGAGRSAE